MSSCGRRDGQRGDSAGTGLGWQRERWKGSSPERAAGGRCTCRAERALVDGVPLQPVVRLAARCFCSAPARSGSSAGSRAGGARPCGAAGAAAPSRWTMLEVFSSRADCVTHELLSVWPGSGCSELRQNRRRVLCVAVLCILVLALVAVIGECPPHPHGDAQPPSHLLGCPRGAPKHLLLQLPASTTAPRASPRGRASQPHLSCRGTSFASHLPNSLPVSAPASVVLTSPTLLPRVPQRLGRFPREMLLFLGHGE